MTSTTARHKLPLLVPGQAQKEMFHNESLALIDVLLHACVEAVGADAPPADPEQGRNWIVGAAPTGAWFGQAHALASWTQAGWRFCPAVPGMKVTVRETGVEARWDGAAWRQGQMEAAELRIGGNRVIGPRQPAIDGATGGATVDAEARAALAAIIEALCAHGLIA